jgi:probable F420-dependent oxidoreductase
MAELLLGVGVPSFGPHAGPEAIAAVATAAERAGVHSIWTFERLLIPEANGYGLPPETANVFDPIETLTWIAARTTTLKLGTAVLDALFHPPVMLARRLATLDVLSGGRVIAGIGQGWMPEEFEVAGVAASQSGARFEEHISVMRACWAPGPVEHDGLYYTVPRSNTGPKPAAGRVPLLIGAVAPTAIERAARLGDGYVVALVEWDAIAAQLDQYRAAGGRGPVVLRANGDEPDLDRAAALGIDEVIWDMTFTDRDPDAQITAITKWVAGR